LTDDKRLIEDYLPIEKISVEASREKSVRRGHISTLHLWWARRPLVACRAAIYAALVPVSQFVPEGATDEKKKSLGRANSAKFVERLCQFPGSSSAVSDARQHILEAHAGRLTQETGAKVTSEDILSGRAPRPRVLDMFAGGGAIPLEALRLGCQADAVDINPVAHIIELCTLVYPQKYGNPDSTARGMAGPKNANGEPTWGGLAEEVRYWGNWVLDRVKTEVGDLYPLIPNPEFKRNKTAVQEDLLKENLTANAPPGYLIPVAYLWTRTVICKNPHCRATVPLVKQTWLCKKPGRYVALRSDASNSEKRVRFDAVEATTVAGLHFDPESLSKASATTCPFCKTAIDGEYVREMGRLKKYGKQLLAVAGTSGRGRSYLSPTLFEEELLNGPSVYERANRLAELQGLALLPEPIQPTGNAGLATGTNYLHGMDAFHEMFTPRQLVSLLTFCLHINSLPEILMRQGLEEERAIAICAFQTLVLGKLASLNCSLVRWKADAELPVDAFGFQRFQMVWDFAEANPLSGFGSSWQSQLERVVSGLETVPTDTCAAAVTRGSAMELDFSSNTFDAVVTDPPYYDNISYSELSDFFYVWMKRAIGTKFREHFGAELTPKKQEIVAAAYRHGGSAAQARKAYEEMLGRAWEEAARVLKPTGILVCVYAHKTTVGWATLVESLRRAGFSIEEAWPLNSEMAARVSHHEDAALASSIFLVARKRDRATVGSFEVVQPELVQIVRERVVTLWEMGISGADLVIACVGAGLRAFTRFARVEYANGDEIPAERFLAEVETVVLETIMDRLSKEVGGSVGKYSLGGVDPASRFYTLWRYTYKFAELDAGEAIIFANGTHVELDGLHGLSSSARPLLEKKKGQYRLLDYSERGDDATLGMSSENGQPAPLIDALHRLLWLMERQPTGVGEFLRDAKPNTDQMRLVAQALAGPVLKGGELGEVASGSELTALTKLTANWRSVVEDGVEAVVGPLFQNAPKNK
jgi:putative DNA methylase